MIEIPTSKAYVVHEPTPRKRSRVRAYLKRFRTQWVADDPEPTYSALDRADGR